MSLIRFSSSRFALESLLLFYVCITPFCFDDLRGLDPFQSKKTMAKVTHAELEAFEKHVRASMLQVLSAHARLNKAIGTFDRQDPFLTPPPSPHFQFTKDGVPILYAAYHDDAASRSTTLAPSAADQFAKAGHNVSDPIVIIDDAATGDKTSTTQAVNHDPETTNKPQVPAPPGLRWVKPGLRDTLMGWVDAMTIPEHASCCEPVLRMNMPPMFAPNVVQLASATFWSLEPLKKLVEINIESVQTMALYQVDTMINQDTEMKHEAGRWTFFYIVEKGNNRSFGKHADADIIKARDELLGTVKEEDSQMHKCSQDTGKVAPMGPPPKRIHAAPKHSSPLKQSISAEEPTLSAACWQLLAFPRNHPTRTGLVDLAPPNPGLTHHITECHRNEIPSMSAKKYPLKSAKLYGRGKVKKGMSITIAVDMQRAGDLPLMDGQGVDLAVWKRFVAAVGKGKARIIMEALVK